MKQQDNLSRFFQKRLLEQEPEMSDWNMPSDDLWDSAKVHFPKPKKKKRRFGYIWFGLGGISMLLLLLVIINNKYAVEPIEDVSTDDAVSITNTQDHSLNNAQKEMMSDELDLNNEEEVIADNKISTSDRRMDQLSSNSINDQLMLDPLRRQHQNNSTEASKIYISTISNEASTKLQNSTMDRDFIGGNMHQDDTSIVTDTAIVYDGLVIKSLPILRSSLTRHDLVKPILKGAKAEPSSLEKEKKSIKRWEIGLSHSPFIASPLDELTGELEEVENYSAKTEYKNFNIPLMFRMSPRYSLSSGISYSTLATDLNFIEFEILENESADANLRRLVSRTAMFGSINLNDQDTSFIEVEFIPQANLKAGDSIIIEGMIPLRLQIVQLPIVFNTHWHYGKFEFLTHSGLSVDLFTASVPDIKLDIYKNQSLISRQVKFESLKDRYIELSFYLGAGLRYKITKCWNLGISANWDLTEKEYSRYEMGTYFRF